MSKDLQEMFDNVVHVGHRTHKWNPLMKKYLYGEKNGIHIIDLTKTTKALDAATDFLNKMVSEGRTVLFVSTKPQSINLVEKVAKECGMPFVVSKWIPGLLTNFSTVKERIKYLADLKKQQETGEFEKYTKKEAARLKKTIDKLQIALGGVADLKDIPDAIVVVDIVRDAIVVKEANRLGIPVIGFADSNSDPSQIQYPIPANDDAIKSLTYLLGRVASVFKKSAKKAA